MEAESRYVMGRTASRAGTATSAKVLQLADYLSVGGAVAPAVADVLPSNCAVPVQDKRRGSGNTVGQHPVFFDYHRVLIGQDREFQADDINCVLGLGQVVCAYRQYFGSQSADGAVVFLQLHELLTAEGSPEPPVEDQHHGLLSDI